MNSEYLFEIFSAIDDSIILTVADAIETKAKQHGKVSSRKIMRIVLIAATVTMLLALTGFVVYKFFVADRFGDYFGVLDDSQKQVMEQMGTTEIPASTSNGVTIIPQAIIADDYFFYGRFRVEGPEDANWQFPAYQQDNLELPDTSLPFLHTFGPGIDDREFVYDENGNALSVSTSDVTWYDETAGDNVLEFVLKFTGSAYNPLYFSNGQSKTLIIQNIWREDLDKNYAVFLKGPWSFEVGLHSETDIRTPNVDGISVLRLYNGTVYEDKDSSMTLRYMSISPISLCYAYDYTCPNPDFAYPGPGTVEIVMMDGRHIEVSMQNGRWTESSCFDLCSIASPIDLYQVAYIQFGNQQIKLQ